MRVTNSFARAVMFHLEPWGEQIPMEPGVSFDVLVEAEQEGFVEVEYGDHGIIVWCWAGSTAKIFCEGVEIGIAEGLKRPNVPGVPDGQTVASFLRVVLGRGSAK